MESSVVIKTMPDFIVLAVYSWSEESPERTRYITIVGTEHVITT